MSRRRHELTDFEVSVIQHLLPDKPCGVPRIDDRKVLNGILWRFRTGSPWADVPDRHGPCTTCYNRFGRWLHGTFTARPDNENPCPRRRDRPSCPT